MILSTSSTRTYVENRGPQDVLRDCSRTLRGHYQPSELSDDFRWELGGSAPKSFPGKVPSPALYHPDLITFYSKVQQGLMQSPKEQVLITSDTHGSIFINERHAGYAPQTVKLYRGRYRVFMQKSKQEHSHMCHSSGFGYRPQPSSPYIVISLDSQ